MIKLKGKGNGLGMAEGSAVVRLWPKQTVLKAKSSDPEAEISRFEAARLELKGKYASIASEKSGKVGVIEREVLAMHQEFLDDPMLVGAVHAAIREEGKNAAWALADAAEAIVSMLGAVDHDLIPERASDVEDVVSQLHVLLAGQNPAALKDAPPEMNAGSVVLALPGLYPSEMMRLDCGKVAAVISEKGSLTSHAAILAKAKGIPLVVGVDSLFELLSEKNNVIVDADEGIVIISPDQHAFAEFTDKKRQKEQDLAEFSALRGRPLERPDGSLIAFEANICGPSELDAVMASGALGIGLYRTEYMFIGQTVFPTEEEQYHSYRKVVTAMGEKTVTFRTLDLGGDKPCPALGFPAEDNPFLGCRAVRISLNRPDLFRTQLRAMLRAGDGHRIRIMFPLISSLEELFAAKAELEAAKKELEEQGETYSREVEVGMMIELPAAAVLADEFALHCDFFSIGTNDLTQHTLAVDRLNERVQALYREDHPAVLRLISYTAACAQAAGIDVAICGEAAGVPELMPYWIKYGIDSLSVPPFAIPKAQLACARTIGKMKPV